MICPTHNESGYGYADRTCRDDVKSKHIRHPILLKQESQTPKLISSYCSPASHCMFVCNQQNITCMSTHIYVLYNRVYLPSPDFIFSLHFLKEAAIFSTLPPEGSRWTNMIKQQNRTKLTNLTFIIIMQIIQCLDISPHFITAILL